MRLTYTRTNPWIAVASLVIALGLHDMVAADVTVAAGAGAAPPPADQDDVESRVLRLLDQRITLDMQDRDIVGVAQLLEGLSKAKIIIDPKIVAAGAPTTTLQVKQMRLQDVLEWVMELTGLRYRISEAGDIFVTSNAVVTGAAQCRSACTVPMSVLATP